MVGPNLLNSAFQAWSFIVYIPSSIGSVDQPLHPQIQEQPFVSHAPNPASQGFPRTVREERLVWSGATVGEPDTELAFWVHPEWQEAFPWLSHGATGRGRDGVGVNFALFGSKPNPGGTGRWESLARREGFPGIVHSRQVHGNSVHLHSAPSAGLHVLRAEGDGHVSDTPGVLMGVTVADCVPVFLVDPVRRVAAMIHAGWRSAAEGILEEGVHILQDRFESRSTNLHVHLGPAICGDCYEVGPEVHEALGLSAPPTPRPVDLRAILALRAVQGGIPESQVSRSAFCTRCHNDRFFSHRCGDPERQVGFLGIRELPSAAGSSGG